MNWFTIALLAPFLWALVNIADKYLITKYAKGARGSGGLILFSSLIGIFISIGIAIFTPGLFQIPLLDKSILVLTGILTVVWVILYLKALEMEDVSSVVPWFLAQPIFGYILAFFFLGENLTERQIMGGLIILFGLLIVSIDFSQGIKKRKFKWRPALYMATASFILAVIGVIFKYVTIVDRFWVSSFWEYVGMGLSGIFIYIFILKYRREFTYMNKEGGLRIITLNFLSEITTNIGNVLANFAILLAPVTMVYLVGSFQPAMLLVLTIAGTYIFPKIVNENLNRKVLVPKIIAIIITIIGSFLLY